MKEITVCQQLKTRVKYHNREFDIEYYSCRLISSIIKLVTDNREHVYSIEDYECIDQTNSVLDPNYYIPFDGFPAGTVLTIRLKITKDMETEINPALPPHIKDPSIQQRVNLFTVQCMYEERRDLIRSKEVNGTYTIDEIRREYLHVCHLAITMISRMFLITWIVLRLW